MFKRPSPNMIIALCTAGGMIAFSLAERHRVLKIIPTGAFFLAAAIICLIPVLVALIRHKNCRQRSIS